MLVYPSFPFIKLWKDVMDQVEFSSENGTRLRKPLEKYGYHMEVAFRSEHARLNTMVVLNVHNKEGYQTEHLKGVEKFNALKNQTFRFQFLTDRNKPIHFTVLNEIAGSVNVYRITRPQAPMDIEKLYQVVKKIL
jgi:hypothetical protein